LDFEKYHAQKLRREPFATGEYVVTGTGNSSFRGMANDVIKAALGQKRKQFEEAVSTEERVWIFQHTIHRIIRELHNEHMQFPAYDDQPIYLELLIGVHFKGDDEQVKLMHCAGDGGVAWMDHHIALGMGGDIAMRFLTILSPDPRPMDVMTAVAFLCIAEAKLSAEGVGGDSELMKLPHPPPPILQTWYSESPFLEIAEEALQLAICAPRENLSDRAFEDKLKAFSDRLRKVKSAVDCAPESERITLEFIRKARSERPIL
jgi:hypothetical protein